ncbi:hypothetical protein L207DRAFT_520440 [Hyaloscypha variabilis F]|uniref:Uncharacterized protein n=1 Tax=Hyaloscypha variabilis (strain UAMH 11265 / GT02V1 / F) TaxID=1149755 RepID=A0A2J6QUV2_HYAVF|nr:hypothetical protein L207DRAFT_520440 [Hyaloscypha variabilis F]
MDQESLLLARLYGSLCYSKALASCFYRLSYGTYDAPFYVEFGTLSYLNLLLDTLASLVVRLQR